MQSNYSNNYCIVLETSNNAPKYVLYIWQSFINLVQLSIPIFLEFCLQVEIFRMSLPYQLNTFIKHVHLCELNWAD